MLGKKKKFLRNVSVMTCDALALCLSLSIDKAQEGCSVIAVKVLECFKALGFLLGQCFHIL